jgi:hypothetical protein
VFDGVPVGRPATGALIDAGYVLLDDLPEDLDELLALHGVGRRQCGYSAHARALTALPRAERGRSGWPQRTPSAAVECIWSLELTRA